jgi:hypothetical protein
MRRARPDLIQVKAGRDAARRVTPADRVPGIHDLLCRALFTRHVFALDDLQPRKPARMNKSMLMPINA